MKNILTLLLLALFAFCAQAKEAVPLADDEAVEQRLIGIAEELRCLVCQNESLAGSRAELANDLRREIRSLIRAGKSDAEIMEFLVSRYGDFVRYRPPLKASTLALWSGPFLFLIGGFYLLIRFLRRRRVPAPSLTGEQRSRAAKLLE